MSEQFFDAEPVAIDPADFCSAVQSWLSVAVDGAMGDSLSAAADTLSGLAPASDPHGFERQLMRLASREIPVPVTQQVGAQALLDLWQAARGGALYAS